MKRAWAWIAGAIATLALALLAIVGLRRRTPATSTAAVDKAVEAEREGADVERAEQEARAQREATNQQIRERQKDGASAGLDAVLRDIAAGRDTKPKP